jgi:hypothetical protein
LLWCGVAATSAATITATLDRDSITVGDVANLQLRFENGNPQQQPVFPTQPNLSIQLVSQGTQRSIINGRISSALILTYAVSATQPGTYTIPGVTMPIDGVTVASQPLRLVVGKEDPSAGTAQAFVRLEVTKTNIYVGELVQVEVKVYGLVIDQLQHPVLKSDGFTIGTRAPATRGREQIGNSIYNVYSFVMTIAPAKAGKLTLGPASVDMEIRVQAPGRRRDPFEEMFGGGGFQRKALTATSEAVTINALPLPTQNVPPSFNGAIGNFQIFASASPTNVSVGDPISLQLQVNGRGSFDTVKLPDFGWKDFTVYPPNTTVTNNDALAMSGTKCFETVVIPQRAGIAMLPPISFSFFDPEQRVYKTVQRPAIPISVKATGHGQAQPTVVADEGAPAQNQTPATDIVHIKPTLGQLAKIGPPVAARPWFFGLQLLPIALWGAAVFWRRARERLANDPRRRRQIEVQRHIAETLPQLRDYASKKQHDAFFATAFRLLQEQIGERLDMPSAAITEAVVDEKIPRLGASAELLGTLRELFQQCNQARYARSSVAGMEALIPKIEAALHEVQALPQAAGGPR